MIRTITAALVIATIAVVSGCDTATSMKLSQGGAVINPDGSITVTATARPQPAPTPLAIRQLGK